MKWLTRNHFKYALILCGIIVICLSILEISGQNESFDTKSPLVALYTFIAPFIVWYFGIKARKDMQKGKLTFKEGLAEGFKISVAFGITSPFIFLVYYLLINPAILNYVRAAYGMAGASDAMVISVDMLVQLISAIVFGTIYGAIVSFFLKSKAK